VALRQRIVKAVDEQLGTIDEISSIFHVHSSYVYKLLRQRRETGDLAPLGHGGGASANLAAEERQVLAGLVAEQPDATLDEQTPNAPSVGLCCLVAEQPDATLDELRQKVEKKRRVSVSVSTIWRWLDELALTRKKRPAGLVKPTR
jgi:transposase